MTTAKPPRKPRKPKTAVDIDKEIQAKRLELEKLEQLKAYQGNV